MTYARKIQDGEILKYGIRTGRVGYYPPSDEEYAHRDNKILDANVKLVMRPWLLKQQETIKTDGHYVWQDNGEMQSTRECFDALWDGSIDSPEVADAKNRLATERLKNMKQNPNPRYSIKVNDDGTSVYFSGHTEIGGFEFLEGIDSQK